MVDYASWRSPPPQETPLVEPASLPLVTPPRSNLDLTSPPPPGGAANNTKNDLLHPAFLPPCEHGDAGDMHAHAFDLLSLSGGHTTGAITASRPALPATTSTNSTHVPSSVPVKSSILSTTRPPVTGINGSSNGASVNNGMNGAGSAPKPRRMSSSTTGVLQRGKLGLTGDAGLALSGVTKDARPGLIAHAVSYSGSTPIPSRRPSAGGSPQLFDFTKTDRRPSHSHSNGRPHIHASRSAIPASLPTRNQLGGRNARIPTPEDDMELDMEFDGDEEEFEDEGEGSGRSGSAELDMDMDDKGDWDKLALGTGSGGIKGRRKGMVFKCEACGKEYRHPSCLVKHRWEHSPHWKEPTALSMSKHQQVQMLEAAAILAHIHPQANQGRPLPNDKSLWPMILSPPSSDGVPPRRGSRDISAVRSPPTTTITPLTPSSLRESSTLETLHERAVQGRKTTPDSDSTTSSMGASEPYVPASPHSVVGSFGSRNGYAHATGGRGTRPIGIENPNPRRTSIGGPPQPGTPQSVGSLPDMGRLNFSLPGTIPSGTPGSHSHFSTSHGVSPIPHRGGPLPPSMGMGISGSSLSLKARTGLVGGGMFGAINTSVRSSSVRSGAIDDDLHEEEEEELDEEAEEALLHGGGGGTTGRSVRTSSSEEAEERRKGREGEEYGMAMEMEL